MHAFEVTFDGMGTCSRDLRECASHVTAAAAALEGIAPSTGRSDTTTMASNAANAMRQDLADHRSTLNVVIAQLDATLQSYLAVDRGIAERLTTGAGL